MALPDLTGLNIQDTYQRILQVSSSGEITDGTGSLYTPISSSHAVSASYAVSSSHEIIKEISSSHANIADNLSSGANININHITASGNISGSNQIIGARGIFTEIDNVSTTHVTASGNISASGTIIGSNLSGTNTGDQNITNLAITGSDVIFGNITASGHISASGKLYSTGLVMAPDSAITPSSNNESIFFRSKLDGTGESAMEFMEIGDDVVNLNANGKQRISISPTFIKFNAQSQDMFYQYNSANAIIHKMQKVGDYNLTFFRDHLSVGSGSSTFPTTDGLQNSNPDGTLKVWGNLNVADGLTTDGISGHITSSGNVSSSGTITATNGFGTINGGTF